MRAEYIAAAAIGEVDIQKAKWCEVVWWVVYGVVRSLVLSSGFHTVQLFFQCWGACGEMVSPR